MRVPAHLDYAMRVMVLLAMQPPGELLPTREAAARLGLPGRFVEQQIGSLAKAGLVVARRGPNGGCALARPAGAITASDVVIALDGEVMGLPDNRTGSTAELWRSAGEEYESALAAMTLETLARRQGELESKRADTYII